MTLNLQNLKAKEKAEHKDMVERHLSDIFNDGFFVEIEQKFEYEPRRYHEVAGLAHGPLKKNNPWGDCESISRSDITHSNAFQAFKKAAKQHHNLHAEVTFDKNLRVWLGKPNLAVLIAKETVKFLGNIIYEDFDF